MVNWIHECYSNLFFDFHNNDLVLDVAAEFDADVWAKMLFDTGAQCVNVTSNDMFGWKYYQKGEKGFVHANLPEGQNMVEETVHACHKRNIRVIAYYVPHRPSFIKIFIWNGW